MLATSQKLGEGRFQFYLLKECNMKVIAIANQKGGVGKTTTAVNLSAGLAQRGFRVLLIDLDSQCNATTTYLSDDLINETLADVLIGTDRKPLEDAIYETTYDGLDIAPSSIRLAMLDRMITIEEQYRLRNALTVVQHQYDIVIIDCPPSLGMVLTAALLAASHVLVPVSAEYYPLEGVIDLSQTIEATRQPNPSLQILGYLLTDYDTRTNIASAALSKMQELFPGKVFDIVIRSNVKLKTAPSFRQSIFEHAPQSHGSEDYSFLTDEVISRLKINANLRLLKEA